MRACQHRLTRLCHPVILIETKKRKPVMQYTRLGKTGLKVSKLCLGCMSFGQPGWSVHPWVLDEQASRPFIKSALDAGINFFDTADFYSTGVSEEILGRALTDFAPSR
jgi:aryl-alcohol dehydrogenase-like predicted oxidoreductase